MINALLAWRPNGWLDYLLAYLIPGALMAAFLLINKWRERPSEFARDLLNIISKEISPWDRFKEFLVFCLGIFCVLFGWPAILIWIPFGIAQDRRNKAWQALPDFDCSPEYLVACVNPLDAETDSYIIDPLGGVPPLPFGHLNKGWVNLLSEMLDDRDEMWSFYIPKGAKTGKYQIPCSSDTRGYAKVRDGKVLAEFITESD